MSNASDIASLLDHSILHPTAGKKELDEGIRVALLYRVASLCIKPWMVFPAYQGLTGSGIPVCTVIGFPSGGQTIKSKCFETEEAITNGATEIDMVVNVSKVLEHEWAYVEDEIREIKKVCDTTAGPGGKKGSVGLKVIFETDYVTAREDKVKLCEICASIGVAFVKTSTGFGYNKTSDGHFSTTGATRDDVALMREIVGDRCGVKASGGVRTLEQVLIVREAGATRIGDYTSDVEDVHVDRDIGYGADLAATE
ncbi:Deoxyribose-phosphate aldolase [Planoprotostelium fungivorum]|uniref:deoxyribose-phosphate aldolase n=1 Tax=Planoprotostelium fungivorum TaxID=1890364 RepID=A0A2P6N4B7_9EUKA|nr:Deoxyribose-phosphate aldolase [Planoprotostelium fungivorum]